MIGALELSENARLLEEAAKAGDREYIDAEHDVMLALYDRVLNAISPGGGPDPGGEYHVGEGEADIFEFDPEGIDEDNKEGGSI